MKKKSLLATILLFLIAVFAFSLTACDNGVITLESLKNEFGIVIDGGGFEEGSELNLEIVTEEQADEIFDFLENSGIALDDASKAYIYDIFVTKDGFEIRPDGNVKVSVPAPVDEKATGYNVYHVKDNGAVVSIPSTYKDGKIIFETDGFSYYVFTATYNIITYGAKRTVTIDTATITNGTVSVDGEPVNSLYKESLEVGSTISLSAEANEGYGLYCWFIHGARTNTEHEGEFTYTVTSEDVFITAVFKPIITELSLTYFDETFVFDLDLAKDADTITVEQFCHERPAGEYYLVAGILEHFSSNGRIKIRDEHGNAVQAELSDGIITTETYALLNNMRNKFVALYGRKAEDSDFRMTDAMFSAFIPDFSKEQIKGASVEGLNVIEEGTYLIEGNKENEIDWETPGEYVVTYYLASDPEICKTITVTVLGESVTFTAWVNNGTILLDGADIGSQYNNKFRNGYGKITLTAKSDENTIFSGWYLLEGNDNTLVSEDPAYTFEVNEDTYVWCEFEYVASEIVLDGANSGFDTYYGETEINLPLDDGRTFDLTQIHVCAMINGEPVYLTLDDYTIDADGFDGTNPAAGVYEVTFTYNANPNVKATHIIHVFGEDGAVSFSAYASAGGRVIKDKNYDRFNKGEQVTVTVELRSETEYEFLGWYKVNNSEVAESENKVLLSTDRTYTVTLNESMEIFAKVEPRITYLDVDGYEGNPTRINVTKFWMAERDFIVYGCGALDKRERLDESEYTVDFGGLDLIDPVVGKYVITYTYNENPDAKYSVTVYVWEKDYSFHATPSSPNLGKLIFKNEITAEAVGTYVEGEEVTVKAVANEGLTFAGWYEPVGQEYVLVSTKAEYTFVIDKDVELMAGFEAPVTSLTLEGAFMDNYGNYYIDVTEGDELDLSSITVFAESMMGSVALGEEEYSIDCGDIDISNLTSGSYTLVYTHRDANVQAALTLNVYKRTYYVSVRAEGGRFEYDGVERTSLSQYFEDGSIVILKAVEYQDSVMRTFLGWYEYDVEDRVWKLFSTDKNVAVTVDGAKRILGKYGAATIAMEVYETELAVGNGAAYFYIDPNAYYDEELGCYVSVGNIELQTESVYVNDLAKLFGDVTLIATKINGDIVEVSADDLMIELGSYKAESGWYNIVVKYGTLMIRMDVFLW